LYGYAGKLLFVDLSSGTVKVVDLDKSIINDFIGGFGGNVKLVAELSEPWVNPFSPRSYVALGVGPLVGTLAPGSSKISVVCRFPLTETFGFASSGGFFSVMMKAAGYDHVVVTGRARKPVYLGILDGNVDLYDASDLWGMDVYQTTNALRRMHGSCGVLAIGKAGEKLVRFSVAVMDSCSSLGRGGLGAVLGAKNLKAIVARGEKGVEVADRRFLEKALSLIDRIRSGRMYKSWIKFGSMLGWEFRTGMIGGLPYDNWRRLMSEKEAESKFGPKVFIERVRKRVFACPSCPVGDRLTVNVEECGEICMHQFLGPAYAFGVRCQVGGGKEISYCYYLANKYGLDYVTLASTVELVRLLRERHVLKVDVDGSSGFEETVSLIKMISSREGLGDVLAEGPVFAARKLGGGLVERVIHVKGMDPQIDGRFIFGTEAFEEVVSPMGGHYISGLSPTLAFGSSVSKLRKFCVKIGVPPEALNRIFMPSFNVAKMTRYVEDWYATLTSLGVCCRQQVAQSYSVMDLADLYTLATGVKRSSRELLRAGERSWNLLKLLNVREGFSRKDDIFPERWLKEPLTGCGTQLVLTDYYKVRRIGLKDAEKLLDDYYLERGWDPETGTPTEEKIRELKLTRIARKMGAIG